MDYVIDSDRSEVGAPARPPVASFVMPEDEAPEPPLGHRLLGPPGPVFHVVCAVAALSMAWAASSPAGLDVLGDPFAWAGLLGIALWAVRLVAATSRRTVTAAFLAAPLMAGVVAGAIHLEIPQESRWLHAEGGFEKALRSLPTAKNWDQRAADEITPDRIGTYEVTSTTRDAAGAVQFHLDGPLGGAPGSAFTYLVDGPTPAIRDANPAATFEHLHGNWYIVRAAR